MAKKIIAIANHKGGVGKTTSVASIGDILARRGNRVLFIDLDAQENLTRMFTGKTDAADLTIYDALTGGTQALPIIKAKENTYIVPSSVELSRVERDLAQVKGRELLLKRLLEPVKNAYDYVLIDTPPSLGVLTINALTSATDLYVPLTAEALPLQGLNRLEQLVQLARRISGNATGITGIFFTRYNNRNLNNAVIEIVQHSYGARIFDTRIRENITIAEAPLTGTLLYDYAPKSNGARDYEQLTNEILKR